MLSDILNNLGGEKAVERDVFLFRSLIAQKQYSVVQAEVGSSAPTQLQAVKCFADYLSTRSADKPLKTLSTSVTLYVCNINWILIDSQIESLAPDNWVSPVMCASIQLQEGQHENALRTLQLTDHIEGLAMQTQIFIMLERVDLGSSVERAEWIRFD